MDVTRKNFKDTLPLIDKSIKSADFLVIDCEFTGLINGREVSIFDSPQEYYLRLLNGSSQFMLIQFGLCAFCWDEKAKHYMNEAYNFYLFPRGRTERMFLCQSSSLDFLATQGFDFNKLIKEGITYLNEPAESRLRDFLKDRQKADSNEKDVIMIPEENKQHIEEICIKVREFLDEKKTDEMEIDKCNAFVRRLLFQELAARFKNEVYVESKVLENKNRVVLVTRIKSENDVKNKITEKQEKAWEEFEDTIGFSKVARMISQSEKLIVGHNMVLDLLHTLNHFFQPLSQDYESFKEFAHCMFPRLLDTKYMSSLPPFKEKVNSSVLPNLLAALSETPFTKPNIKCLEGRGYSITNEKHHEAGYDAFITGVCFLSMYEHLSAMRGEAQNRVASVDSAILKPFLNKIYLSRTAHQDSPYIFLTGKEPLPSRDHVFYLIFPKEWQKNEINQLFSPFGPITVQFIDDISALVALARRDQARDVMRSLAKVSRCSLVPYAKYRLLLEKSQQEALKKKTEESLCVRSTADFASRTKFGSAVFSPEKAAPVKVERKRTNSAAPAISPSNPSPSSRKRSTSGIFKVDEAEPPAKKFEPNRSPADVTRPPAGVFHSPAENTGTPADVPRTYSQVAKSLSEGSPSAQESVTNGRRKLTVTAKQTSTEADCPVEVKTVIETFVRSDSHSVSKCVKAFQESESWD